MGGFHKFQQIHSKNLKTVKFSEVVFFAFRYVFASPCRLKTHNAYLSR